MIYDPRWDEDQLSVVPCATCGEDEAIRGSVLCDSCNADEAFALDEEQFWQRWLGDLSREADLGGPRAFGEFR